MSLVLIFCGLWPLIVICLYLGVEWFDLHILLNQTAAVFLSSTWATFCGSTKIHSFETSSGIHPFLYTDSTGDKADAALSWPVSSIQCRDKEWVELSVTPFSPESFVLLFTKNLEIKSYRTITMPVVSCQCGTWCLTLMAECRLRVLKNRVLREICGVNREEVTGEPEKST